MCSSSNKRHIPCLKLWILKIGFFGPKIFFQEKLVMRYLSTHKSSHFIIGFSSQLKMNENFENRSECVGRFSKFLLSCVSFPIYSQILSCSTLLQFARVSVPVLAPVICNLSCKFPNLITFLSSCSWLHLPGLFNLFLL